MFYSALFVLLNLSFFPAHDHIIGDFDGDSIADTCFAEMNADSSFSLTFRLGNGVFYNGRENVLEIIDDHSQAFSLENLSYKNYRIYNLSELKKSDAGPIPSLESIVQINLNSYASELHPKSDVILLDFFDVYYILSLTSKNQWLFINLGV
ncbi:MAG: hypothetical protein MRY83_24885 [Flavobacteriales bacterium]|nr:hypothetical protein [Flavobacteriales bacterium]